MSGNTRQITPFMHVADLDAAVRFLTDTLGFTVPYREANYAYVERQGAAIRILAHDEPAEIGVPHGGFSYYIDVTDLDEVLAELGPKLAELPPGDVIGPVDQPYSQRELMIRAPDRNLLVFGQAIRQARDAVSSASVRINPQPKALGRHRTAPRGGRRSAAICPPRRGRLGRTGP